MGLVPASMIGWGAALGGMTYGLLGAMVVYVAPEMMSPKWPYSPPPHRVKMLPKFSFNQLRSSTSSL
jgi:hypothetical protein